MSQMPTTIHTEMRRQDRAVDDPVLIKAFLQRARSVVVAFNDEPHPYAVPLSYGFEVSDDGLILYFHGAAEGHKADLIAKNPEVSFVIAELGATMVIDDPVSKSGQNYFSVIGSGSMQKLEGEKRIHALEQIMHHYAGDDGELSWEFPEELVEKMGIWAINVKELSAKTRQQMF